ncbi:hypothetical protein GCM10010206_35100 [Streptomyces cinerochromogenes]|nr:hypothetical protein GCM10010206_35100 [Streptomyces cinerochromogenes]
MTSGETDIVTLAVLRSRIGGIRTAPAGVEQARADWMTGSRVGEVKGYDGKPLPAPELPALPLKPRGRTR